MKSLPFVFVLLVAAALACGDVIVLNDGTRLEGTIQKTDDGWTITDSSGKQTNVTPDEVKSFEVSGASADTTADALASLRRSAQNMSDLQAIIDRYQKFIADNSGSPATADAQSDLALWKQRLAEGQVKVGDTWMTPAERQNLISQEAETAASVRDLLQQGRTQEAQQAIQQALAVDANNPSILYLQGLELANQDMTIAARTAFLKVAALVPDHGPTLNDLAVVYFREKLGPVAMKYYWQAMQAEADNKQILSNVAEALHALSPRDTSSTPAQRAFALWKQQNAALATQMQAQGLFPWGATWITRSQLDKCQEVEQENQQQQAQLQSDFDSTQKKIDVDQQDIQTDQQDEMTLAGEYNINNGRRSAVMYNNFQYQQYQSQIANLQADIAANQQHLAQLQLEANQLESNYPVPKYTGTQELIGPEGTPLLDAGAQTQPTSP